LRDLIGKRVVDTIFVRGIEGAGGVGYRNFQ